MAWEGWRTSLVDEMRTHDRWTRKHLNPRAEPVEDLPSPHRRTRLVVEHPHIFMGLRAPAVGAPGQTGGAYETRNSSVAPTPESLLLWHASMSAAQPPPFHGNVKGAMIPDSLTAEQSLRRSAALLTRRSKRLCGVRRFNFTVSTLAVRLRQCSKRFSLECCHSIYINTHFYTEATLSLKTLKWTDVNFLVSVSTKEPNTRRKADRRTREGDPERKEGAGGKREGPRGREAEHHNTKKTNLHTKWNKIV